LANSTVRSVIYIALRYKSMDDHAQEQQENLQENLQEKNAQENSNTDSLPE
jgi:hypothetical protein